MLRKNLMIMIIVSGVLLLSDCKSVDMTYNVTLLYSLLDIMVWLLSNMRISILLLVFVYIRNLDNAFEVGQFDGILPVLTG